MQNFPEQVKIVEVGPRDGLQNETVFLDIPAKVEMIEKLAESGLGVIEAGSFVSARWVPQMADSDKVFAALHATLNGSRLTLPALVPNLKGLERAQKAGVKDIAIFAAASERFSQKNMNATIDESLGRYEAVCRRAIADGMRVRGYVSCILGCPYEGRVDPQAVRQISKALYDMGCYEISLGDTIGVGTPLAAQNVLELTARSVPMQALAVHFHDTYGMAVANIFACLEMGVSVIDSSISGLGGCPYAPGSSGNVATEDVVYMLNAMGIETGVDLEKLLEVSHFLSHIFQRAPRSRLALARGVGFPAQEITR